MTGTETNNAGSPIRPRRRHLRKLLVLCGSVQNARLLRACRVRFWLAERHWRFFWSLQPSSGPCRTIGHAGLHPKNSTALIITMWPMAWPDCRATIRVSPRDVPRLGPPLPGDLGRPIVAAQAQSGPLAVDAEQQRMNQESEAARTSKVFASTNVRPSAATTPAETTRMLRHRPMRPLRRMDRIASSPSSMPRSIAVPRAPIA